MAYLDHIRRCNAHDMRDFVPFRFREARIGWVRRGFSLELRRFPGLFHVFEDLVHLEPTLASAGDRTEAVAGALETLASDGVIGPLRGEPYPVLERPGDEPLFEMDRRATTAFGVVNMGFHLNGLVGDGDGARMWLARRAPDKTTYPNMLDNLVAGGQPAGISPAENVVKECAEEAGIPETLARRAIAVSATSYTMEVPEGLRRHAMWCYDLDVPADFRPEPVDGEVGSFELRPVDEVAEIVETSEDFKYNCNLVVIDWLIRSGRIGPEHPDYLDLCLGLRSPWP